MNNEDYKEGYSAFKRREPYWSNPHKEVSNEHSNKLGKGTYWLEGWIEGLAEENNYDKDTKSLLFIKFQQQRYDWQILQEELNKVSFDIEYFKDFSSLLKRGDDRTVAIIAAAYADDILKWCYENNLNGDLPGGIKVIIGLSGPLGEFSNKLNMAYALNWVTKDVFDTLKIVAKIRNKFAHDVSISSFGHIVIKNFVEMMHPFEFQLVEMGILEKDANITLKKKFQLRFIGSVMMLIHQSICLPKVRKMGFPEYPFLMQFKGPILEIVKVGLETTREIARDDI